MSIKSLISLLVVLSVGAAGYFARDRLKTERNTQEEKLVSADTVLQNLESQRELQAEIPKFDIDNPMAIGIILKFHQWPSEQEEALILEKLKGTNLQKTMEFEIFKMWVFEWPEWHKASKAEKVCDSLPKISSLEYCTPEYLNGPAFSSPGSAPPPPPPTPPPPPDPPPPPSVRIPPPLEYLPLPPILISPPPEKESPPEHQPEVPCDIVTPVYNSIFPKKMRGGLGKYDHMSLYWAQDMIGGDLLKKELIKAPSVEKKHFIGVIDTPEDHHYIHVKNLISDKRKHSVLPEIGNKIRITYSRRGTGALQEAARLISRVGKECSQHLADSPPYQQCKANNLPSFINFSMRMHLENYTAFESLSPPTIVVAAAGNEPTRPEDKTYAIRASQKFNMIIVGNMDTDGNISGSSEGYGEVHIVAPSGSESIITVDKNGTLSRFGRTSGATALVTGSLAAFEWLAGYHPTAEEAKLLLKKTAIPTLSANAKPRLNGVGMVNSYKLGMVGKRLKEICGTDISCFKEKILKDDTYVFPNNHSILQEQVRQAFPECSSDTCHIESNWMCGNRTLVFEKLRKAAFLNSSNKELWRNTACIYYANGFTENAQGTISSYKALKEKTTCVRR